MQYAIVTVPAAPVRKKANHRAEMSNQLLFGEAVKILKVKDKWMKIESLYDGYKGWLTDHLITFTSKETAEQPVTKLAAGLMNKIIFNGQEMHIPAAASLRGFTGKQGNFDDITYTFSGDVADTLKKASKTKLIKNARLWLNAPYLWGGKTILGVDCSGFVQTMYKLTGIPLSRDAWQQAGEGMLIKKLSDAQHADLAFFDDKDEIVHVGILLGPDKIIHSAGKVRIDAIDKKGIINSDTGKRTHNLKLIKRF